MSFNKRKIENLQQLVAEYEAENIKKTINTKQEIENPDIPYDIWEEIYKNTAEARHEIAFHAFSDKALSKR